MCAKIIEREREREREKKENQRDTSEIQSRVVVLGHRHVAATEGTAIAVSHVQAVPVVELGRCQ